MHAKAQGAHPAGGSENRAVACRHDEIAVDAGDAARLGQGGGDVQ